MYMPSFAKDLVKKTEPVPEKTLTRKWIEHLAKQVGLTDDAALNQNDAMLLKMATEKVEALQASLKEFNELKAAVKFIQTFYYPVVYPRFSG